MNQYMKDACTDLGNPTTSTFRLYCPICEDEEVRMVFSGWMDKWVDYGCPLCGFVMSFRCDFSDPADEARTDGSHFPKSGYLFTEDEKEYHLVSKSHLRMLEIMREKRMMPVEGDIKEKQK